MSLHDGLIACFPLNSDGNDITGNYSGTVEGASFVAGKLGNCASFDGTDDYISLDPLTALQGSEAFTIAFWLKVDAYSGRRIFEYGNDQYRAISIRNSSPSTFYISSAGSYLANVSFWGPTVGAWAHIVCTYNGTVGTVYKNTTQAGSGGSGGAVPTMTGATACIGSEYDHSDNFFNGDIYQFCIWDRVLTSDERSELYNSGDGIPYPFGEISVGAFEITAELTGRPGSVSVGAFELTAELTATVSNENIDYYYAIVWDSNLWVNNGIKKIFNAPNLGWYLNNSEIHSTYVVAGSASVIDICSDDLGNCYVAMGYGSNYYLDCIDKDGENVWHIEMPTITVAPVSITTDGTDYLYVGTNTSNRIYKFNLATGAHTASGGFPVQDSIIDGNSCKKIIIGRDDYLYAAINDSGSTYKGYVYKIDPADGSEEWNYQLPQGGTGHSVNDIDIDTSGNVAVGSVALNQTGDSVHILDSSGAVDTFFDISGLVKKIAIDESGYLYCAITGEGSGIDFGKYDPGDGDPEANPIWTVSTLDSVGGIALLPDESGIFYIESTIGKNISLFDTSDGSLIYEFAGYSNGIKEKISIPEATQPAWQVDITAGANGTITNELGAEFETGTYFFPAGEDITFTFTGDPGYDVEDVSIDSVSQGQAHEHTFTAISGMHTIVSEFMQAVSAGAFETTLEITANYQINSVLGAFEATTEITALPVLPMVIGAFEIAGEITANYQINSVLGAFEATGELTGSTLLPMVIGAFEIAGEITVATKQTIVVGALEIAAELAGVGELIDITGAIALFKFVLTGSADGTTDIEIPISSFQMRMYDGSATYLSVTVPNIDYADEISDRSNGNLDLYLMYVNPADFSDITIENRIVVVAMETVAIDNGTENKSVTLSGYETTAQRNDREANPKTIYLDDSWFSYVREYNGSMTVRMVKPHLTLSAGDTISYDGSTFPASRITWLESNSYHYMEITEAA